MTPETAFSHPVFAQLAAVAFGALLLESLWLLWRHRLALPWPLRLVDDFVCLPVVLLGFDPVLTFLCMGVSFTVQFLVHTNAVGKLGPLEWVFNTPSNHRVHHHAEGTGQRRNYGAALIVWDRLFGTWEAEQGPARFGLSGVPSVVNPLELQLQGFKRLLAARREAS